MSNMEKNKTKSLPNEDYQFERDKSIDIVGNCANCGIEYHIHRVYNIKKTIREHFESFPEPYRTQALNNRSKFQGRPRKVSLPSTALWQAFDWGRSNEGLAYWDTFCRKLEAQEQK